MQKIILFSAVFLIFTTQISANNEVVEISGKNEINLVPNIRFMEDPDHSLSVNDMIKGVHDSKFQRSRKSLLHFGFTHSA
ncbi:MAG: hypothetical protein OEZ34_04875, partial [Spirochaetia bacterium]|nr:hypothetical protein [Spirochaetia bacterium]